MIKRKIKTLKQPVTAAAFEQTEPTCKKIRMKENADFFLRFNWKWLIDYDLNIPLNYFKFKWD